LGNLQNDLATAVGILFNRKHNPQSQPQLHERKLSSVPLDLGIPCDTTKTSFSICIRYLCCISAISHYAERTCEKLAGTWA
jgi:hypothetical protein